MSKRGFEEIERTKAVEKGLIKEFLEGIIKFPYEKRQYEQMRYMRNFEEKWRKRLKE